MSFSLSIAGARVMALWLSLLLSACLWVSTSLAQGQSASQPEPPTSVKVGILPAPPFVFKNDQGQWDGLAMALWQKIIERYPFDFELVELQSPDQALEGIRSKELLTVISGVNITSAREKYGSFSTPFYVTDMAAALSADDRSVYATIIGYLSSDEAITYIAVLIGLILLFAVILFIVESRRNPVIFDLDQGKGKNMGQSLIWSVMLATGSDGNLHKSKTLLIRFLSMLLYFVGAFTLSAFVAILSSALTVNKLGAVNFQGLHLHEKRVGVISNSRSAEYCRHQFIACETFDRLEQGMANLKAGKLDVVLGQKVEMQAEAAKLKLSLDYVDVPDRRSYYAFFFRDGFAGMNAFNDALTEVVDNPSYADLIRRYVRVN